MKAIFMFSLMLALLFSATQTFAATNPSTGSRIKPRSMVRTPIVNTVVTARRKLIEKCIRCNGKLGDPGVTCVVIQCPKN